MNGKWNLEMRADCGVVSMTSETQRVLEIVVNAPAVKLAAEPLPLNLSLVLDRSGSMSGAPLEYVKRAACHVVDMLSERDRLTVVTFDSDVQLLCPSTRITRDVKSRIKRRLKEVRTGGSTALHCGWVHGVHEVAAHQIDRGVNRCLLLTDGQANVGEVRVEVLMSEAAGLAAHGVATSTFGVGEHFNHHLLEGMARGGRGSYYFIESPRQIPDVFRRELGELVSVVGRGGELEIQASGDCDIRIISDVGQVERYRSWTIPLYDLYSGDRRSYFVDVRTSPHRELNPRVKVTFRCSDSNGRPVEERGTLAFTSASEQQARQAPADRDLRKRATKMRAAEAADLAMREAAEGDQYAASNTLGAFMAVHADELDAEERASYGEVCEHLMAGSFSPMQQKSLHSEVYRRRMSRR